MMARPRSILALGDSYTIGEGVDSGLEWPVQLSRCLSQAGIPAMEPRIVAQTGWTAGELADGLHAAAPRGPFDLVTLLVGVNNQYRGRSLEEYRDQLSSLMARAVGLAGGDANRVLVLSIPDWGVTPFAEGRDRERIAREIDAFNAVSREESSTRSVHYLDVTEISREARWDPALVANDGLHPSGAQYARWVGAALPLVMGILGSSAG